MEAASSQRACRRHPAGLVSWALVHDLPLGRDGNHRESSSVTDVSPEADCRPTDGPIF